MKYYKELAEEFNISLETFRSIVFRSEFEKFRTKKKCFYTKERNGKKFKTFRYIQAIYANKHFYSLFERLGGTKCKINAV